MKRSYFSYFLSLLFVVIFFIFALFFLIAIQGIPINLEKYLNLEAFSFNIRNSNAVLDHVIEIENARAELYDVILGYYINKNNPNIQNSLMQRIEETINNLKNNPTGINISFAILLEDKNIIIGRCYPELTGIISYEIPEIAGIEKIRLCPPIIWLVFQGGVAGFGNQQCTVP